MAKEVKENLSSIHFGAGSYGSMYVVHKAVTQQLLERRQGSANCKTRSEVRGGAKKPWKQKGTGRARAGSNRSPLWRGGGVIIGPKTKNYYQKINKKERWLAIRNTLYNKKDFIFSIKSELLDLNEPKTKALIGKIDSLNLNSAEKILIVMAKKSRNTYLASRNLSNIEIIAAHQLNLLSIIRAKYILIEEKAVESITQIYDR